MIRRAWGPIRRFLNLRAEIDLISVGVGVLIGGLISLAIVVVLDSKPPVQILDASEIDGLAQAGGVLEMRFRFLRRQECHSTAAYWLWQWRVLPNGDRVRYAVSLGTSFVTLADPSPLTQEFVIAMQLPPAISPGDWMLRSKYLDYCRLFAPVFGPVARSGPDVPVRIEARR